MTARSCGDCANISTWEELGHHCWDCTHPVAAPSAWRENLDAWGIDPARFCGYFVLAAPDPGPEDFGFLDLDQDIIEAGMRAAEARQEASMKAQETENATILAALRGAAPEYSTGRWDYVQVGVTGKDADLEVGGHQGYDILRVEGDTIHCAAKCGQSIVGNDVCLNFPEEIYERKREEYLDFAYEAVCGFPFDGEWDGDGWWLTASLPFTAALARTAASTWRRRSPPCTRVTRRR